MSTNDTVLALANGAARKSELSGEDLRVFQAALNAVCISLAKQIARDGEGATKLITVRVDGAATEADARTVGLSVANSNLVKTAVFGRDPNWGRILCAAGYAGVAIDPTTQPFQWLASPFMIMVVVFLLTRTALSKLWGLPISILTSI